MFAVTVDLAVVTGVVPVGRICFGFEMALLLIFAFALIGVPLVVVIVVAEFVDCALRGETDREVMVRDAGLVGEVSLYVSFTAT